MSQPSFQRRALSLTIAMVATVGIAPYAQAQPEYPSRPITLIVGYPAGGSTDLTGRLLGAELSKKIGAQVVIENVGGAGGVIGAQRALKATPDGYTLFVGAVNEMAIAKLINRAVKYDGLKDFTPIGLIATQPLVLVTTPQSNVKTPNDFVANVRAHPGKTSFGSSGVGTALHLGGEMVKEAGKLEMVHVPYRGVAPLTNDLLGGQLQYGVFVLSSALPQIRAGKLTAIGLLQPQRTPLAPEIGTITENAELKNIDINMWFGLYGPVGMPEAITQRLQKALAEVVTSPDYIAKMKETGATVAAPNFDLVKFQTVETAKYKRIVDFAKIEE